jgi:hypothetical protein
LDLIAYALREEFTGTVEQDGETVPVFTGGVIRAGDTDIDVREELEAGGGIIVVDTRAAGAIVHLDEYPPLKRVKAPADGAPTGSFTDAGPYAERTVDELRTDLRTRGIAGAGSAKRDELVTALNEHDQRLADVSLDELGAPLTVDKLVAAAAGELETAGDTAAGAFGPSPDQPATGDQAAPAIDVAGLSTDELVAVLEDDRAAFERAGEVEVPAAVDELRARAAGNDGIAVAALEAHGLATNDDQAGAAGEEA